MHDLTYLNSYTPKNIPSEFEVYNTNSQSKLGMSGKVGILRLKLKKDYNTGRTVIREQYSRVPLMTQRAMYLEESLPEMAYLYIVSPSGGILQGDRFLVDITLENNTVAHVTTQGATRIYKMENDYASQIVNIKVGNKSYFEYIPDQIIPYLKSRFYQEVELNVHDNATMLYSEVVTPGRVASGEAFEYDICYIKTVCRNQKGRLRFMDTVRSAPKYQNMRELLNHLNVVGTIYLITNEVYARDLQKEINEKLNKSDSVRTASVGTSLLPSRQGVVVRILGEIAPDVRNIILEVVTIARKRILNASFSAMRKA